MDLYVRACVLQKAFEQIQGMPLFSYNVVDEVTVAGAHLEDSRIQRDVPSLEKATDLSPQPFSSVVKGMARREITKGLTLLKFTQRSPAGLES